MKAIQVEATIFAKKGCESSLTLGLQCSEDKEHWLVLRTWSGLRTGYHRMFAEAEDSFIWLRLTKQVVGTDTLTFSTQVRREQDRRGLET